MSAGPVRSVRPLARPCFLLKVFLPGRALVLVLGMRLDPFRLLQNRGFHF